MAYKERMSSDTFSGSKVIPSAVAMRERIVAASTKRFPWMTIFSIFAGGVSWAPAGVAIMRKTAAARAAMIGRRAGFIVGGRGGASDAGLGRE